MTIMLQIPFIFHETMSTDQKKIATQAKKLYNQGISMSHHSS